MSPRQGREPLLPSATASQHQPARSGFPFPPKKTQQLLGLAAFALTVWFCPHPSTVTDQAWRLLAIFLTTIVGIVTQPLPTGAVAAIAASAALITKTLTYDAVFKAFTAEVPWLIAIAMFLAEAVTACGLGARIAYHAVAALGSRPLGLAYALVLTEAAMSPAIPSVAARSGGIVLPLVKGFCAASGSRADNGTAKKLGAYLMVTCFQTAAVSSALFLTANHPNPLSAKLAEAATNQAITWAAWAQAAVVPGLACLLVIPLVTYLVFPPTLTASAEAQDVAREKLAEMGGLKRNEIIVAAVMVMTVTLWVFGHSLGISSVAAALTGLSVLLLTDVIDWKKDCLAHSHAWDTMWWFAIIIALATQLKTLGLIEYFSGQVASAVSALGWGWQPSFLLLLLVYYYSHYFFASNVAHVSAMYSAFLAVMCAAQAPPMLAALILAFLSNTMGGLAYWTMSHAPMYFGEGYVSQKDWLSLAFLVSVVNLVIWLGVGSLWWKFLQLY